MRKYLRSVNRLHPPNFRRADPRRSGISGKFLRLLRHQDPSVGRQVTRLPDHPALKMGGALDAALTQDPTGDQDDFGTHSMCSGQASSAYPAVKTPESSPRAEGYGSPRDKTPRIQVPIPTDKLTKKSEPPVPPRLASGPRLFQSDQHLEKDHFFERDAIGGAMSAKLVSWAEPLKITPNHPGVVERNARYLARLYHEAKVKEPPIMEWTFLANVMQAYTGNKETLFARVACVESKQHMFWIHCLREPFSTKLTTQQCIDTLCSLHMVLTLQAPGVVELLSQLTDRPNLLLQLHNVCPYILLV